MKREDTYIIYRSEARGEAARDARNTSEGKKSFIRMKQKFLPKETAVPSEGNFAHSVRPYSVACKLLTFVFALLFIGANWNEAWGQTTILAAGNRDTVHTRTEIIYVEENASRELYLPELRINDGVADASYQWYVHWYISEDSPSKGKIEKPTKAIYLDADAAKSRGGNIRGGYYASDLRDAENDGLWWYKGFYDDTKYEISTDNKTIWKQLSSCASTIVYTAPESLSKADTLFCDVSSYTNFNEDELNDGSGTFTEPTLLKRYKYIIRPASECANALNEGPLEKYEIDYPAESKSSINLTMLSLPGNYFWYESGNSGNMISAEGFEYRIGNDGSYVPFSEKKTSQTPDAYAQLLKQLQVVKLSGLDGQSKQVVSVRAINGEEGRPILAQYTFNPISDSGFKLEEGGIPNNRAPEKFPDLYEEIGVVDFDQDNVISTLELKDDITKNMDTVPMPQDETVYGFMFNYISSVRVRLTPMQNQYGLYRTANVEGISINSKDIKIGNKDYRWIPPLMDPVMYGKRELYDRTYVRTKNSHGFFYYIDASDDPGTLVDVPIKGTLCGYTELVVTAWLADMTRPLYVSGATSGLPLAPNINLILKGTDPKTGEEVVLHYFTSGDAITDYGSSNNEPNKHLMKWQQLCYRIVLPAEIDQYRDFHLEVQNNEPHTDGADYAIDDVRVYKTLPNIKVQREDACDASSLTISVDYQTMLMNMGWQAGEAIVDENTVLYSDELDLVKYRFGLNGSGALDPTKVSEESHVGNTYFSFVEGFDENTTENVIDITDRNLKNDEEPDPIILEKGHKYRWVRVNKSLTVPVPQSMYSFRIINSTIKGDKNYPSSQEEALRREKILNFRAVKDYNTAVRLYNEASDKTTVYKPSPDSVGEIKVIPIDAELNEDNIYSEENEEKYRALVETLYMRLQIPRIRCPWIEGDEPDKIYLYTLDVNNTDLKYVGEQVGVDSDGKAIKASGEYHVVLQGAQAVEGWQVPGGEASATTSFNLKDPCVLKSPFKVQPAVRVTVETMNNTSGLVCLGTQRQITAELLNKYTGEPLEKGSFGFDWFLGTQVEYNALTMAGTFGASSNGTNYTLKDAINEYRDDMNDTDSFDRDAVEAWQASNATMKEGLLSLFDNENGRVWLLTDKSESFTIVLDSESIVAMPFIKTQVDGTLYCTEITEVPFDDYSEKVPEIHPGVPGVEYPTELANVPLRLGLRHIANGKSLTIPLQKDIKFAVENTIGHSLIRNPNNTNVSLYVNNMPTVATLQSLTVEQDSEENSLTLTFNDNYTFAEGQEYILLIPFSESEDGSTVLGTTCDGLARLPIKIVPEYLTWQSGGTNWYNEGSETTNAAWKQSTEKELYMGDERIDQDANGSDDINNIYSPLYFTKITIPSSTELALVKAATDGYGTSTVKGIGDIQYDMAVDTLKSDDEGYIAEGSNITVRPYYINKVSEIYFKPEATLMNQHYLEYDTARVEFTMERNKAYWMASPLHGVYAGDMYAPYKKGIQNTPAFQYILFDYGDNSSYHRWELPFYQKAWNKEVAYSKIVDPYTGTPNAGDIISVDAVKSNWSIEYNDVWVPYTIGKGFYMRVDEKEGDAVTVRLPKADSDYIYQVTKAGLSGKGDRTNAGRLATTLNDGIVEVDLKKVYGETASDVGEGEARHFLVGNPYMTYLNMAKFLEVNSGVLNDSKYWTLANGAPSAVVGTPDVEFSGENGTFGSVSGTVKPMEAFFIEVKAGTEDTNLKVTFTPEMMSSSEITATAETRSYSATNPTLTITAERGETRSVAKLLTSDKADNGYEASEDAVVLLDSELDAPMVYTVSGSRAAQVNAMKEISNVGLGIYNENDDEATVTISGLSRMATPLYLYDAATRQSTRLEGDSYELRVSGDSHGRYFLRDAELGDELENTISIYSARPGEVIVSSLRPVKDIRVFALNGSQVRRFSVNTTRYTFTLPAGIYLIQATDGERGQTEKVLVR